MRAPGALGKATTIPGVSPMPPSSSVPCVETWWELPLQWAIGTQLTLVMRTLVTCGDEAPAFGRRGAAAGGGRGGASGGLRPAGAVRACGARERGEREQAQQRRDGCRCKEPRSLVGACARQDLTNSFERNHPPAG